MANKSQKQSHFESSNLGSRSIYEGINALIECVGRGGDGRGDGSGDGGGSVSS